MTYEHFSAEMDRLLSFFGGKPWTSDQLGAVWRSVGEMDGTPFTRVIDDLTTSNVRLPPIGAVLGRCRPFLREIIRRRVEIELQGLPDCRLCGKMGTFWAVEKGSKPSAAGVAFRCSCRAAGLRGIDDRIVAWRREFFDTHTIVNMPRTVTGYTMGDFERGDA